MWSGVVAKGGYDRGKVEIEVGRGRGGGGGGGVRGGVGFLRFRCLFEGWPFSRLAGMEGKRFLLDMGRFWWSWMRPRSGWKLGQGRVGRGVPWLGWPEVAIFGGAVLVPGRAGGRSGGPALLISVRWARAGVVRMAAAS